MLFNVPDERERDTLCVVSRSKMSETRKRNTKAEREKEGEEGEIGSLSPHLADEMRVAQLRPVCTSVSGLKRNVGKKNVLRDRKTRGERERERRRKSTREYPVSEDEHTDIKKTHIKKHTLKTRR